MGDDRMVLALIAASCRLAAIKVPDHTPAIRPSTKIKVFDEFDNVPITRSAPRVDNNKYTPHSGAKEIERRKRQMVKQLQKRHSE